MADFGGPTSQVRPKPTIRQLYVDLPMDDPGKKRKFQDGMKGMEVRLPEESDEEYILRISISSAELVEKLFGKSKRRAKQKDGWSPTMMAMIFALESAVTVRRHVRGFAKHKRWVEATFPKGIARIRRRLRARTLRLGEGAEQLLLIPDGHDSWKDLTLQEVALRVGEVIIRIKGRLHGRKRTELRTKINRWTEKREGMRLAGKIGYVIRSMLEKPSLGYSLQELQLEDDIIVDDRDIHGKVTEHFRRWFERKVPCNPEGMCHESSNWRDFDGITEEEFLRRHRMHRVPDHILSILWRGQRESSRPSEFRTKEFYMACPSRQEFEDAIARSANNSSPGITGLSYNMIKNWQPLLKDQIYAALANLWSEKKGPGHWMARWLVPIPKKEQPTLLDLRPLSLYETLRKLWMSVLVNRVQEAWTAGGYLNDNQHGFIRKKGTDTAIALFADALETAKEWKTKLFMTSWDMKRAFDRLPKQLMTLAWVRLGVPAELAEYMVSLDSPGVTLVRSPRALKARRKSGMLELEELSFVAECGTGQGDISSPAAWNAAYDILLTSLALVESDYYLQDDQGEARKLKDQAYADDLISVTGTLEAIQKKADVVSGFCIIYGLELSIQKFRSFAINWGNPEKASNHEIIVHTEGWLPTRIGMKQDGSFKHLGVTWDMDLLNNTQHSQAIDLLRSMLSRVVVKTGSPETKWVAVRRSLYERIAYYGKFMPWSLSRTRELDKPISAFIRRITKNMPSFPEQLIYLPINMGGLGKALGPHPKAEKIPHGKAKQAARY
jgi:hypothetical protein